MLWNEGGAEETNSGCLVVGEERKEELLGLWAGGRAESLAPKEGAGAEMAPGEKQDWLV